MTIRRILSLLALALPLAAQVQNIPDTTFPIVRSLMNSNFAWLQGAKLTPPVVYSSGTAYLLGDTVTSAGAWYVSIQLANIGNTPASSPTFWAVLAPASVNTFIGRSGAVTGATNDYSFSQISGVATAGQLPVIPVANGGLNTAAPAYAALTDTATVTWALAGALVASADLTFTVHSGARTLNLTGLVSGGQYVLRIVQDSTGGEGLTLGTGCTWKVSGAGAGAVTPSVAAGAVDLLAFSYDGLTTSCYANFNKNFN